MNHEPFAGDPSVAPTAPIREWMMAGQARPILLRYLNC